MSKLNQFLELYQKPYIDINYLYATQKFDCEI